MSRREDVVYPKIKKHSISCDQDDFFNNLGNYDILTMGVNPQSFFGNRKIKNRISISHMFQHQQR